MELILQRKWYTHKSTIGELFINHPPFLASGESTLERQCFTLEDVVRAPGLKIQNETAIGAGRFRMIVDYSNRFKRYAFHILDVPNYTGVRAHSGNTDLDTDGCVLVGDEKSLDAVLMSHVAFNRLWETLVTSEGCAWDNEHDCQIFRMKEETWIEIADMPQTDTRDPQDIAA